MDAGIKQGFIHVNVPHACEECLVQQQRLYLSPVAPQAPTEFLEPDLERLRSEPRDAFGHVAAPFNTAELARVLIQENALVERENSVRMLGLRCVHQQLAGHTEVYR